MSRAEDLFARITTLGENAIDEFIRDRQSEELFLDFKRSSDNGAGAHLSNRDRDNLARAISGFGNSEGGVIVWGVDCRPEPEIGDVAAAKVRIENPRRFKSWLENGVSGLTVPPHPEVKHITIESGAGGTGFVITYIAKSYMAPHQCIRPVQYFMRVGSSFEPIPHGVLAGMFGRFPQPVVFHMWSSPPAQLSATGTATFDVGLLVTNRSPAIARDVYVIVMIFPPGGNSRISASFPDLLNWSANQAFGVITQVMAKDNYKLAPNVIASPMTLSFELVPPFEQALSLRITTGCSGSYIKEFRHRLEPEQLRELYGQLGANRENEETRREFVKAIIGARPDAGGATIYDQTSGG
jgi:hypothetical protein